MRARGIPICALVILCLASQAVAAPEDPGPWGVTGATTLVEVAPGLWLPTDIYMPDAEGAFPVVVLRHGYARSKENFAHWGRHLASRGFIAVVFTSRAPLAPNPEIDSDDQLAVLDWAVQQGAVPGSLLEGKVDGRFKAVMGHSAGGLCAVLAASKDSTVRAAVFLDPGEVGTYGAYAAPRVWAPSVWLFADPGNCNLYGNGVSIFEALAGPKFGLRVPGSGHCDCEDPSDSACGLGCGANAQPEYQILYRRYATAFLEAFLKCDPAAYPYVVGPQATADPGISILSATNIALPPVWCGADGGTGTSDGGLTDVPAYDAGLPPDGTMGPDAAARDAAAAIDATLDAAGAGNGGSGPASSCRYAAEAMPPRADGAWPLLCVLVLAVMSRSHLRHARPHSARRAACAEDLPKRDSRIFRP